MNGTRTAGLVLALLLPLSAGAAAPTVADRYRDSYAHEAKGELTEALAEIDALPKAQRQTYVYQLRRGWLLYLLGRYWDSLEAYRAAAKLRPKAIEPQLGMMLPEAALLLWLDVLETGRRIRDRAPHDYLATSRMAWAAYSLGRFAEAESLYAELVELHPADVEMRAGVGWSQLKQGRRSAARATFEAVLQYAPDHASARLGLVLAQATPQ
ncbi:MAG: tetratricopeptide repeat protein [Myxococcales bacterium]|nr:tetratricopeptide repeat protein [Myxococcales bacterium]